MSINKDPNEYQLPEPIYEQGESPLMGEVHCDCYSEEQVRAAFDAGLAAAIVTSKPKKATKPKADEPPKPADVTDQTWTDFLAVRKIKKAPLTPTALAQVTSAAEKAGYTLEAALQMCCERGWQAFRADWVTPQRAAPGILGNRNYGTSNGYIE